MEGGQLVAGLRMVYRNLPEPMLVVGSGYEP